MKRFLFLLVLAFVDLAPLWAQDGLNDSVDALHYDLRLDIGNRTPRRIEGSAAVTMRLLRPVDSVALELTAADVDSVWVDGSRVPFCFNTPLLKVPCHASTGDTLTVTVFYRKGQHVASGGWGGFYFDNNIYYNLGVATYEYPHNAGKMWFPCRDNFYDKATYHLEITAMPGWRAICSGLLDSTSLHADSSATFCWSLNHPTPTYLVGVAVAPFHLIERDFPGNGTVYPGLLGFLHHDSARVWNAFVHLDRVIPFYERCLGPYRWDRVGYVSTPLGSMEHVGNVAFTTSCMASSGVDCLAIMGHEFAHSWFGNLLTCSSAENMWINEGGASFCEELAIQAIAPDGDSLRYKAYADDNLYEVLLRSHILDDGFRAVHGLPHDYTYGSTVYKKGATVWHSLRGYLGDSLFYASMRRLFDRCAFGNIDSYRLRDSLSLYSGVDLSAFFDFHVFSPGFNDYVVDSLWSEGSNTMIIVHQKNYGTSALMDNNRVWVSFFSDSLRQERRLLTFDGEWGLGSFQLPFTPAFALVDYDKSLSRAAIGTQLKVDGRGVFEMPLSLFETSVSKADDTNSAWLYVTHHWCRPDSSDNPRFARMADHYWEVSGLLPSTVKMNGKFRHCRIGQDRSLDEDLYADADEFKLVKLLYRETPNTPWRQVSSLHTGSSSDGFFVANSLKLGQYTFAFIDTSVVDIPVPAASVGDVRLYPNPSQGSLTVATDVDNEPLSVDICDLDGRMVHQGLRVTSGSKLPVRLKAGVYVVSVRRDSSVGQTSLKVVVS